jgi:hypothetical protein
MFFSCFLYSIFISWGVQQLYHIAKKCVKTTMRISYNLFTKLQISMEKERKKQFWNH